MDKEPYVSPEVYEYFNKLFSPSNLLNSKPRNVEGHAEHLGYLKGVEAVLLRLQILSKRME